MVQNTFSGIDDAISLGFDNVAFPFAILSAGLVVALMQVIIEALLRCSQTLTRITRKTE